MTHSIRIQGPELIDMGYQICEIVPGSKACLRQGWQDHPLTKEECAQHVPEEGVGILCGVGDNPICAVDADIEGDPDFARAFYELAVTLVPSLAAAPVRVGKAPKLLFVCRAEEKGWTKATGAWFVKNGVKSRLEVLGKGQQFVAYAIHPGTGKPYHYPLTLNPFCGTEGLVAAPADDLPVLTKADIEKLMQAFEDVAEAQGYERVTSATKPPVSHLSSDVLDAALTPDKLPLGIDRETAERWVRKVKWDVVSYDSWMRLGAMLSHEFRDRPEEGLQAFINLSLDAPNASTVDEITAKYESFRRSKGEVVTMRTIYQKLHEMQDIEAQSIDPNAAGLAAAFIVRLGERVRWLTDAQSWLIFNGVHWVKEGEGPALYNAGDAAPRTSMTDFFRQFAIEYARIRARKWDDAHQDVDPKKREKNPWAQEQIKLCGNPRYAASIVSEFLATSPHLMARLDEFDAVPNRFPTANGSVDLLTGAFMPPKANERIHKHSSVAFVPGAKCPRWEQAVDQWMCGDKELSRYLQKLVGYAAFGDPREGILTFFVGGGGNGKSLCLGILAKLFGALSRTASKLTLVSAGKSYEHAGGTRSDLAVLRGARLVVCSESEEGDRLRESEVKVLTGGEDKIVARDLYQSAIEFKSTWLTIMATNHMPTVLDRSEAIYRRIRIIPFNAKFNMDPEAGQKGADKDLKAVLESELPGILNWAIEGAKLYRKEGLSSPKIMREQLAQFRDRSDYLGQWYSENCRPIREGERVDISLCSLQAMWKSWQAFAKDNACGDMVKTIRTFSATLKSTLGFDIFMSHRSRACRNFCLRTSADDLGFEEVTDANGIERPVKGATA